jgi:hypothetical protein
MFTSIKVEQMLTAVPAEALGAVINDKTLVEVALAQPGFVALSVNITLPAAISAALGVYVQVVKELAFVKVPVPLDVHVTVV